MNSQDQTMKKLTYGSYEKILAALDSGAGMLFGPDVEILINKIKELENDNKSKN